jgi:cytochrome c peroxidase
MVAIELLCDRCRTDFLASANEGQCGEQLYVGIGSQSQRGLGLPNRLLVTDIGRAMVSGKCADIGKFKGPILRGLAGRAPYFHNGSAATLMEALDFYDTRFGLHLSQRDKDDLVAFLKTL